MDLSVVAYLKSSPILLGWHWVNSTCTVLSGEVVRTAQSAHGGNLEKFEPGWLSYLDYNSLLGR